MKKIKPCLALLFILFVMIISHGQEKQHIIELNKNFNKNIYTNFDAALKNATEAVSLSEQLQSDRLLLTSYSNLSEVLYNKKENEKSRKFVEKAILLALKLEDLKGLCNLYNRLGSLKRKDNDYVEALNFYEKALKIAESNNFKKEKCIIENNLARLFWISGDRQKAARKLKTTISLAKQLNYQNGLADAYNILGVVFLQKNKDSSLYYYQEAYALSHKTQNKYLKAIISSNLGDLYLSNKDYDKSLNYLLESEKISEEIGDKSALHYINISLGIYFENLDDFQKAIEKYEKAITVYGDFVDDYQKMKAYWIASGVFYHSGNYKRAYLYQENYTILKDSLFDIEKSKEFNEIKTLYEVEKKNNQIVSLEKENALASLHKRSIVFASLLLLIPLLLLVLFYRHRLKSQRTIRNQELKIIQKEKEQLKHEFEIKKVKALIQGQDKEKNRLAKELHDGLGGYLAGIKLSLSNINSSLKNSEIKKVNNNLSYALEEIRLLSHSLSSNYIDHKKLEFLLLELKEQYESKDTLAIHISIFPKGCLNDLKKGFNHHIYMVLQELLNNVSKHSNAQNVNLSFTCHHHQLIITFEDDGIGFSQEDRSKGIGLKNIEDRIFGLDGKLLIDSLINRGTHITIEIPTAKH